MEMRGGAASLTNRTGEEATADREGPLDLQSPSTFFRSSRGALSSYIGQYAPSYVERERCHGTVSILRRKVQGPITDNPPLVMSER